MRLKEASAVVWETYPDAMLPVAEFVTEFGGAEGVILLVSLAYWFGDRKKSATVAAYVTGGVVLVLLVKTVLGLPRPVPDAAIAVEPVVPLDQDPHGFPSGHAFTSVVVYGGFATVYDKLRNPVWMAGVCTAVVAISLSRVVLRLHYLGDILAGAALGIVFLAVVWHLVRDRPLYGFALAVGIAVPATVASGFAELTLVGLGAGVGGTLGSRVVDAAPPVASRVEGVTLLLSGGVFIAGIVTLQSTLVDTGSGGPFVVVVAQALLVGGVLLLPFPVHRLDRYRKSTFSTDR